MAGGGSRMFWLEELDKGFDRMGRLETACYKQYSKNVKLLHCKGLSDSVSIKVNSVTFRGIFACLVLMEKSSVLPEKWLVAGRKLFGRTPHPHSSLLQCWHSRLQTVRAPHPPPWPFSHLCEPTLNKPMKWVQETGQHLFRFGAYLS